jgi:apolipoprotein N-acyltransferase
MKDAGTHHRGPLSGFSPLAGVSAGTAAVLFAFGVLALAWHQVSGHVSLAVTMLAYAVMFAVAVAAAAGAWLAVLWVAHRHRHPELLVRRPASSFATSDEAVPQAITAAQPAAIEPPRMYFTDDQFAAIMRHRTEEE